MKRKYYIIIASVLVVILVFFFFFGKFRKSSTTEFEFETAVVQKGKVLNTVTASGALEALETVEVGTQVSGVISAIFVDFNSVVKKGQVLAKIDETPLIAQLNQSQANVDQAEAEYIFREATYNRNLPLFEKQLISEADFDQVLYNYNLARANLASAKAQNERNRINLRYATIMSPIDGVILDRAVDAGQTVAASFNTPTLFTIANDLTRMKVEASVDEADIGQVRAGQRVEFSVDAFPDDTFSGRVTEVRLQPVITNNVVTYTVIIDAPNPEKKLMPGMTAIATIYISEADDQLTIPMGALSFDPDRAVKSAYFMSIHANKAKMGMQGSPSVRDTGNGPSSGKGGQMLGSFTNKNITKVWLKVGDSIFMRPVKVTLSDGINSAISEGLSEGDEVLLGMRLKSSPTELKDETLRSPFMPRPPRRR
jgi:HlyD family secretion protein